MELKGDTLELTHPNVPEGGTYERETDRLLLSLLFSHPPFALTRRKDHDAVGFYPRVYDPAGYEYRKPVAENDGWATASLSDVGMEAKIKQLIDKILAAAPSLDNPLNIHSLLIARHGKLVLEEYFYGNDDERPHDMRSASKTIETVLVGIARDHHFEIGPDTPVYSLFKNYAPSRNWDERKSKIKLEDFMNMASGLAIDDADSSSPGEESRLGRQPDPDWCRYTLNLPMARDPDGRPSNLRSANINVAGCAVRIATKHWLPEFSTSTSRGRYRSRDTT